jgi:hypothetical protein
MMPVLEPGEDAFDVDLMYLSAFRDKGPIVAMRKVGIHTVGRMCALSPEQLTAVAGLEPRVIEDIQRALSLLGLSLAPSMTRRHVPAILQVAEPAVSMPSQPEVAQRRPRSS